MGPINIDFDGLIPIIIGLIILAMFGMWKVVEIIIWLINNVTISW
jgi:hypothetical protein